ncbi:ornithine cyclodeaminase family protein [Photobacterium halotolerans]|uniref:ornithine cyclodeaminase family protein n=1 Tax=Photobacterium halotolerans TaxID=265726 RepID=UPI0003FB25E7|nr:ornithine cyclodeaminase family protein [Photobacterium halotolerans]
MQFFDRASVESALPLSLCLELCEAAFTLQSAGQVQQSLRDLIRSDDGRIMGNMPAFISEGRYEGFGVKSVLVDFTRAPDRQSHEGCVLLYDAKVNHGMVSVDAGIITELRTAAASAWATHLLAPESASKLAILGTGVQARRHLQAMLNIRPVQEVTVWSRTHEHAEQFAKWCRKETGIVASVAATPAQAVQNAEIVCTVTASRAPILYPDMLPECCHINAVGASALGFQELSPDVYAVTDWFLDGRDAAWNASQCLREAREKGVIALDQAGKEIGEIHVHGGWQSSRQRTLFKSVGLAVLDLVFAREVVHRHREINQPERCNMQSSETV